MVNNMLLAVDIGNTNITFGVFQDNKLIKKIKTSSKTIFDEKFLIESFKDTKISKCIIASVVEELTVLVKQSLDNFLNINAIILNNNSIFNMKINLDSPQTVGIDRLVNTAYAKSKFSSPIIVIDIGTAITFDIVSKEGDFIGGIIMNGLNLQLKSLNQNTSKLPKLEIKESENAIGNSTQNAILSGVIRGTACAIEGLINQCEKELDSKATIIATGGDALLISNYMNRKFDYIEPDFTLEGLNYLYELNNTKEVINVI